MPDKHAILSPSGAHRWMVCTPSARLEQQFADTGSDYAAEGTLAHAVAELKLREAFVEPMGPKAFAAALNKLKRTKLYDNGEPRKPADYWPEILKNTDDYLDYVTKVSLAFDKKPYVTAEQKLSLENYIPESFGTADTIVIGAETMHVIDFKYGKGVPVDATENPQIMSYALGALEHYRLFYRIENVIMTIFQPRLDNISEYSMTAENLINWGVFTLKPKAQAAFNGEGDYVPRSETCRFCRARVQCRARAGANTALEDFKGIAAPSKKESGEFPKPPLLTDAEVGEVLKRAVDLEKWAADLKDYALSAILEGKNIPGWKAVEGRSKREFDNTDDAFDDIKAAGFDEALLYERKPLTLAAVEKVLGKGKFAEVAGTHIVTPPGKPTLVDESDKRPPYHPHDAASDFAGVAGK